jgi:thioredoxin-related protein
MDRRINALGLAGAIFVGLVVITQVTAGPFSLKSGGKSKERIAWLRDIKQAHKEATAANRPMLIVFGASWCTYCHKLERETLGEPEMVKYVSGHFVPVHLDFDKDRKVADILEVTNLPACVVLSPDADLLANLVGYMEEDEMRLSLDQSLKAYRTLQVKVTQTAAQR